MKLNLFIIYNIFNYCNDFWLLCMNYIESELIKYKIN